MTAAARVWGLHIALLAVLFVLASVLPPYHVTNLARVMVLAVFAMGYNIAFGYTGLLSLGHALFFAAGMYAAGFAGRDAGWPALPALVLGAVAGAGVAAAVGLLVLRTAGVAFMIVTMMFAQAGYLTILYFGTFTGGDEGFIVADAARTVGGIALSQDRPRYLAALVLFAVALVVSLVLVRARAGRILIGLRENEERCRMLGYDPFRVKLLALALSGAFAGVAGASYGILFGYVGASFATIQYSILPLLWVLLGGAGTVIGPFLGALLMFYLIDAASSVTTASLGLTGAALLVLVLFAPRGILGTLRDRWIRWLP